MTEAQTPTLTDFLLARIAEDEAAATCSTCAVWDACDFDGPPEVDLPCPTLRSLASTYADHPDYREGWRP